jgi:hypothetical protein
MKKIINGKLYDTSTAKEIGSYWNGLGDRDFNHISETLYRKKTGEFFLYGEGGPMTKYAESIGQNEWSGGEEIIPLTVESARQWAEDSLSANEYEKIFGPAAEDDSKQLISANIKADTYAKLKSMSAETGKPMSTIIDELVANAK